MEKLLEVGDKVERIYLKKIEYVYTIDRVTKTHAIAGQARFMRKVKEDSYVTRIGNIDNSSVFYKIVNQN